MNAHSYSVFRFNMKAWLKFMLPLSVLMGLQGCESKPKAEYVMTEQTIADLKVLSQKCIFFGHQSVGGNIIGGLQEISSEAGGILRIQELEKLSDSAISQGWLMHSFIGENQKPLLKCSDFKTKLARAVELGAQVAMMKFCYIDINPDTDVESLFDNYDKTMKELKVAFPSVTFVHITVPLTTREPFLKGLLKKMLGKDPDLALAKRNHFNARLLEKYRGEPIFDLALEESKRPDGSLNQFQYKGESLGVLAKEWTYDGGHLNPVGRKHMAAHLSKLLAEVVPKSTPDTSTP